MLIKKNLPTDPIYYDNLGSISEMGEIVKYVYVKEKHPQKKEKDKPSLIANLIIKIKEKVKMKKEAKS